MTGYRHRRVTAALVGLSLALTACGSAEEEAAEAAATDEAGTAVTAEVPAAELDPVAQPAPPVATMLSPTSTYDVVLTRDPFDPVREPPAAPVADATATDGSTEPGVPGGVIAIEPVAEVPVIDPITGEPGTAPACTTNGDVVCDGVSVLLLDVTSTDGAPTAIVQVDTVVVELTPGETFYERFRLLTIDGDCASFIYGDQPFTLCEGDQILK